MTSLKCIGDERRRLKKEKEKWNSMGIWGHLRKQAVVRVWLEVFGLSGVARRTCIEGVHGAGPTAIPASPSPLGVGPTAIPTSSSVWSGGLLAGRGRPVFVKAPEVLRNLASFVIPGVVPRRFCIGVWSEEGKLRMCLRWSRYLGQSNSICSRVCNGAPQGQAVGSSRMFIFW